MRKLLLLVIALALPAWAGPTVKIGEITWYKNYDEALNVAKQRGVPLWLHFGENPG